MRIRIDHATTYAYDRAARFIIQTLRLTPRSSEAQQVRNWRVETAVDARLRKLAVEANLDPEFSEKFLRFIIQEVIRHHEQAKGQG